MQRVEGSLVTEQTLAGGLDPFGYSFSTGGSFGNEAGAFAAHRTCVKR